MFKWDKNVKPPIDICPEQFCFSWVDAGGKADLSGNVYDSVDEAYEATTKRGVVFIKGGCSSPFGKCRRLSKDKNDPDLYEACEPNLERAGLPDLFFCTLDSLIEEVHPEYIKMAWELWDDQL